MNIVDNKITQWVVAVAVGGTLALMAYQRATDPEPIRRKQEQEQLVLLSRDIFHELQLAATELQFVDPLAPDRKVGKTYIWPSEQGWDISGYYRRGVQDQWHPYLMALDSSGSLLSLSVRDSNEHMQAIAASDPRISAVR